MTVFAYSILAAGWLLWLAPFLLFSPKTGTAQRIDPRARWGILLVGISYAVLWQAHFWEHPPMLWQLILEILFFALAALLSWTAKRALGRQWRIDAGLNADHELITSGPYRIVRHPIYTSMLCVLLGSGILLAPWWLFLISGAIFITGTEIRVHIEDSLLSSRFGGASTRTGKTSAPTFHSSDS